MKQHLKKPRVILSLLIVLALSFVFFVPHGGRVYATVPPPTAPKKNYIYTAEGGACASGDFPILGGSPLECMRLLPNNNGYTISPPISALGGGGCGSSGPNTVYEVQGLGNQCINITPADYGGGMSALWDVTTYDSARTTTTDNTTVDPAESCAAKSGGCETAIFTTFINPAITFLSAGVGILVVAMIIVGGIRYSSAGDDPQKVAAARSQIINALLGLVAYIFMWSFLQWVVPGGIFH